MTVGSEPFTSRLELACEPSAMRLARAHAKGVLMRWCMPKEVSGDALVIVAELATNAVRHAGRPTAPHGQPANPSCRLSLVIEDRVLHIAVQDEADEPPVHRRGPSLEESGRGLQLVDGLSGGAWGWQSLSPGPGKVVWSRLALPDRWQRPPTPLPVRRQAPTGLQREPEPADFGSVRRTAVSR